MTMFLWYSGQKMYGCGSPGMIAQEAGRITPRPCTMARTAIDYGENHERFSIKGKP